MKIQCSCGAKYAFDVTPEMAQTPVRFVCPTCGADSSELVNKLIREEAGESTPGLASAPDPAPAPAAKSRSSVRIRVGLAQPKPPAEVSPAPPEEPAAEGCARHGGAPIIERCRVCQKPLCAKCMEVFGYVCSPRCKAQAESRGMHVPVYGGQRSVRDARFLGLARIGGTALAILVLGGLGLWIWYGAVASRPHVIFSVRYDERAYSGDSALIGADQLVFLHGDTLARYDIRNNKEIWSRQVVAKDSLHAAAAQLINSMRASKAQADAAGNDTEGFKIPSQEQVEQDMEREAAAELQLHVVGQNIWLASSGSLTRYDWDSGRTAATISLQGLGETARKGNELLATAYNGNQEVVTHIDLASGQARAEVMGQGATTAAGGGGRPGTAQGAATAGLPIGNPEKDSGRPLNPNLVASQARQLTGPAKIALPALLAANENQQRALAEMRDSSGTHPAADASPQLVPRDEFSWVPTPNGVLQFSARLVEARTVQRNAMKPKPGKSALDGNVGVAQTSEVANELLNEMQRNRGGDTVIEDQSLYRVTLRHPDSGAAADWSGEMTGTPALFPLESVNVIIAGTGMVVLDQQNKLLWKATLGYPVPEGANPADSPTGQGPCVEHDGTVYVYDKAMLTAFDLATGNARWRFPSVGVVGLFFDEQGMIYVNSTTAGLDTVKYSRQIDISSSSHPLILKLDAKAGTKLWASEDTGLLTYVSGKFLYALSSYQPEEPDDSNPYGHPDTGLEAPPCVKISRLNPKNGAQMWEYFEQRAPLSAGFDRNLIRLVFRKEVEVLKYTSF